MKIINKKTGIIEKFEIEKSDLKINQNLKNPIFEDLFKNQDLFKNHPILLLNDDALEVCLLSKHHPILVFSDDAL